MKIAQRSQNNSPLIHPSISLSMQEEDCLVLLYCHYRQRTIRRVRRSWPKSKGTKVGVFLLLSSKCVWFIISMRNLRCIERNYQFSFQVVVLVGGYSGNDSTMFQRNVEKSR